MDCSPLYPSSEHLRLALTKDEPHLCDHSAKPNEAASPLLDSPHSDHTFDQVSILPPKAYCEKLQDAKEYSLSYPLPPS